MDIDRFGQLVVTASMHVLLDADPALPQYVTRCLSRHFKGDFGEICDEDCASNLARVQEGVGMMMSAWPLRYTDAIEKSAEGIPPEHPQFWIITQLNPLLTTVLLPEEY